MSVSQENTLKKSLALGYGLLGHRKNGLPAGYFPHWEFNVYGHDMEDRFQAMFNAGSGGELDGKACAVHSSSMLSYNFLHWISSETPLLLDLEGEPIEFTEVRFEIQMKTLPKSRYPANMDVLLISRDGRIWLMLESKFTEYLDGAKFDLSSTYSEKAGSYYSGQGGVWLEFLDRFKEYGKQSDRYYGGIKQNVCHLIAIRNLVEGNPEAIKYLNDVNKLDFSPETTQIVFRNLVFCPDSERFKNECERFEDYKSLWKEFATQLQHSRLKMLNVGFMTYSDLWQSLAKQIPEDLRMFLYRRYMQFTGVPIK